MKLPGALLEKLGELPGYNSPAFQHVHQSGEQITSLRVNNSKLQDTISLFPEMTPVPWTKRGFYLSERPSFTFDPLFHAGCYYVQEASSMFLEQALVQTTDLTQPLRVLDLCAAPGGKSTHLQSLLSKESLLVSNEVIRSRCNILKDNIIKWGCENTVVTNNDPKDFARLENYFDIIVVDAPCSGSGLFRRDPEAIEEWSENNVQLCSQRQQRILADVWPALTQNGLLVYSTCSYSKEEDEDIVNWITQTLQAQQQELRIQEDWGITKSGQSFRFWPDKVKGEGFFLAAFRKQEGNEYKPSRLKGKTELFTVKEQEMIRPWLASPDDFVFYKGYDGVYAATKQNWPDFQLLLNNLRVVYAGVKLGEIMKSKLVPDHALALSSLVAKTVPCLELDRPAAIRYLQRKEVETEKNTTGWQRICHQNHPLGWVNVLPNRVNNYYPKELRILKEWDGV